MYKKVKCKICGKVGLLKDTKGLMRHLRLVHNEYVSKKNCKANYYEPIDDEAIIEIKSEPIKKILKPKFGKSKKIEYKSPFVKILFTPMGNKR